MAGEPDGGDALAETAAATEPQVLPSGAAPPRMIGRFVVDGLLGRGGMGQVLAAHDPDLDRKVAIKLLHDDGGGSVGRSRLMREAQAMARLRHPNVVTVHEIGTHDGRLFVAMELVPGGTLRGWMERHPGALALPILEVFLPAGRGLAAAHVAGLVHRDFKPENVLLDETGRVLVTDFGLAGLGVRIPGAGHGESGQERTDPGPAPSAMEATVMPDDTSGETMATSGVARGISGGLLHHSLTRTGDVMGTPRYMSPEQHRGDATDARTDQFAFCAAMYEALYGVRAFAGDSYDDIRRNAEAGKLTPPPADRDLVAPIHAAVLRGMRPDPDERWPSMEALLDALTLKPPPAPARWRWLVGGVLAAAAIAIAVVLLWPHAVRGAVVDPQAEQRAAVLAAQDCDCELITVDGATVTGVRALPGGAADRPWAPGPPSPPALQPTGQLLLPRGHHVLDYAVDGVTYGLAVVSAGGGTSRKLAFPVPESRAGFVFVPGGDVPVGEHHSGEFDEQPVTIVRLAPYLLAIAEEPDQLTFADARSHAWAAHARLPTAAEWEWAARLGVVEHQLGNRWEWTGTVYVLYPYELDGRDDALAEGETIEVRGGQHEPCPPGQSGVVACGDDPKDAPRPSRRLEGRRTGRAELRLARTPSAAVATQEVTVRIVPRKSRVDARTVRVEQAMHREDASVLHRFIETWVQQDARPALQAAVAPDTEWCSVRRELIAVGAELERIEVIAAPPGEPRVIVRWNPAPDYRIDEPEGCRTVVDETTEEPLPDICFDDDQLQATSVPVVEQIAELIIRSEITELAISVRVPPGTPDAYALSERRGEVVRRALFKAGVKAMLVVDARGSDQTPSIDPDTAARAELFGREPERQGGCDPTGADRVDLRIMARR